MGEWVRDMILDVGKFIQRRRPEWDEFESIVQYLESGPKARLNLEEAQRFHYLYERLAADLAKLSAYAADPEAKAYLESLIARGFGEMHGAERRVPLLRALANLVSAFPSVVRKHVSSLMIVLALFTGGMVFGGLALALDPSAKAVMMPFSHLMGDPSDRVAEEEKRASESDPMEGAKSTFSAELMTHNTKVAIFTLALGMTFGIGTGVLLFYNGAMIGAVMMDYILAGESVFLAGWLLPHGSVEIPAILLAGQGGILLGRTLLFAKERQSMAERLRGVRSDLMVLIAGVAVLLIWAGIIESFFSQYHEPILPYSVKIVFGTFQLTLLVTYLLYAGNGKAVSKG